MNKNTWGLIFDRIDEENDEIIHLLGVNLGSEEKARYYFDKIRNEFSQKNEGCLVNLVDENNSIVDDYALSLEQVNTLAALMGHRLIKRL